MSATDRIIRSIMRRASTPNVAAARLTKFVRKREQKAKAEVMLELIPVLEAAVTNAYLCQNDRGIGNEWDDEIKRAEDALERAAAYQEEGKVSSE